LKSIKKEEKRGLSKIRNLSKRIRIEIDKKNEKKMKSIKIKR